MKTTIILGLTLMLAASSMAQDAIEPPPTAKPTATATAPATPTTTFTRSGVVVKTTSGPAWSITGPVVKEMTVYAAPEPRPALKYMLRYLPQQQKSGNSMLLWSQSIQNMGTRDEKQDEQVQTWLAMPPDQLPQREVQQVLGGYSGSLRYARLASERNRAEWEFPWEEGINMLMPSLNDYRRLARLLALQARMQIAQGNLDEAVETLRTGFALADAMGKGQTLINSLVGIAIETIISEQIATFMQHKDAPNLYWAIADLPQPLVNIRLGLDSEQRWIYASIPELKPENRDKLSAAQWQAILTKVGSWGAYTADRPKPTPEVMFSIMLDYERAKKYLRQEGYSNERIEKMSASAAVGMYWVSQWEYWISQMFKWHRLPVWEARRGYDSVSKAFEEESFGRGGRINPFMALIPSLTRARHIQVRTDRVLAALQLIEAVRMHAAAHKGQVPATLEEMFPPAPQDPMTGKAFDYSVKGNIFTLQLTEPPTDRSQVYIVTVKPPVTPPATPREK